VAHLGAGASITAIQNGLSVDTSMGFTPLEGLVMATRSGTVDPGAVVWLQVARGLSDVAVSEALEHASGTLGIAGTADMAELLRRAAGGEPAATLARDVYVHRARSVMAAMAVALDRLDAIVFTGGVGENSGEMRDAICAGLGLLGVTRPSLALHAGEDGVVSPPGAPIGLLVVHAREDLVIAAEARHVLGLG
jgi:acetate kinase